MGEVAQGCFPPCGVAYVRYWGRPVSWWSVEVNVGAVEIVIRKLLSVRWQEPVRNKEWPVMKQPSYWLAGEKI